MKAATLNLETTAGDGYSNAITIQDSAGVDQDQSAYTWRAQVRKGYGATTATDFTVVQLGAVVTISLTAAQTRALGKGVWVWDAERRIGVGDPQTILSGTLRLAPDVTQDPA